MPRFALLLCTFNVIEQSLASYCGQAAIPFTFQVLHSGQPVLGCARPKCFGWNANGTRAGDAAQFYRIDGKEDGYLRRSDQLVRSPFRNPHMIPRVAKCEEKFSSQGCAPGQWLGGIAPRNLVNGVRKLQVRCCWYAPLLESEDRGVAMVSNGQLVVGGEVLNGDELNGFDYIADITAKNTKQGNTIYAVSIRRMECKDADDEIPLEPMNPQNAVVQNLDRDVQVPSTNGENSPIALQPPARDVVYAAPDIQAPPSYGKQLHQSYGMAANPAPRYIAPPGPSGPVGSPVYTQTISSNTVAPQPLAQPQQYAAVQNLQTPFMQSYPASYLKYNQVSAPAQAAQPLSLGLNNAMTAGAPAQNMNAFMQYPTQRLPQPGQQQPLQQVAQPIPTTPFPTIPPLTFPTLDQIPKIDIPSVEDVENVIPPVQKAILTTVARFFGVL